LSSKKRSPIIVQCLAIDTNNVFFIEFHLDLFVIEDDTRRTLPRGKYVKMDCTPSLLHATYKAKLQGNDKLQGKTDEEIVSNKSKMQTRHGP